MTQATINDTGNQLIGHVNRALTAAGRVKIRVMSYNVAQFTNNDLSSNPERTDGNGNYVSGRIRSSSTYNERKKAWCDLLNGINPDILGMVEYLAKFRYDVNTTSRDAILSNFPNYFEEVGSNEYLGKAVYSTLPIGEHSSHVHATQKSGDISRNYVVADIGILNTTVKLVVAHLAYSTNGSSSDTAARTAQINEIITAMSGESHVIIVGDFNVMSTSEYNAFANAGYVCANHGYIGDVDTYTGVPSSPGESVALDNIIVKGFDISNIHVEDAAIYRDINGVSTRYPLSDHNPIWCDLLMKL